MKKRVMKLISLIIFLFALSIMNIYLVLAAENDTASRGYDCLEEKVEGKCSSLTTEEKIFSLLAIGECEDELLSDSLNEECWPKGSCKIKMTAQAILALNEREVDVNDSSDWLLSQKMVPTGIDWLLQIETSNPSKCTISYSGASYSVIIGKDKKLSSSAGSCLSLFDEDYWLRISSSCYQTEFQISCNSSFSTNLLYKEQSSSIIYVSQETNSASAEGKTKEKVDSYCFKQGTSCDYEGSLWAAMVLNSLDNDVSSFLPYLVTGVEKNQQYLPEVFLYALLGESYRNEILMKQKEDKYWGESGDKFYDTALALLPFQYEELLQKDGSIQWLGEIQGKDGCWQNTRNTAFILYSLWPKEEPTPTPTVEDCEDEGNFCMSATSCQEADGTELDLGGCFGINSVCCTQEIKPKSCEEQNGEICDSDETCIDGTEIDADDLSSGETCCIGGECEKQLVASECEDYGDSCKSSCLSDEEETERECFDNDICCTEKAQPPKPKYIWIIILSILIFIVAMCIVFRKKLKLLFAKFRKKGKHPGPGHFGGMPPSMPPRGFPPHLGLPQRILPRRVFPSRPSHATVPRRPVGKSPTSKPKSEINEVLKKLKEMGGK
jgi:hypothetical protein